MDPLIQWKEGNSIQSQVYCAESGQIETEEGRGSYPRKAEDRNGKSRGVYYMRTYCPCVWCAELNIDKSVVQVVSSPERMPDSFPLLKEITTIGRSDGLRMKACLGIDSDSYS